MEKRWKSHLWALKSGKHENPALQNAWNKYGESAFSFDLIEECSEDCLDEREMYYIGLYDSYKNGYNCNLGGVRGRGQVFSIESRMRMSAAKKGKPSNMKGRRHSKEAKERMRKAQRNRPPISEETRMKLSKAGVGRKLTEEARRKISESKLGKPRPIEHMRAAWNATRGKPLSQEHKEKIRKVDDNTAREIHRRASEGEKISVLADEYGVSTATIRDIKALRKRFAELDLGGIGNVTNVSRIA